MISRGSATELLGQVGCKIVSPRQRPDHLGRVTAKAPAASASRTEPPWGLHILSYDGTLS